MSLKEIKFKVTRCITIQITVVYKYVDCISLSAYTFLNTLVLIGFEKKSRESSESITSIDIVDISGTIIQIHCIAK